MSVSKEDITLLADQESLLLEAPITAFTLKKLLNNPLSVFFADYQAALVFLAWLCQHQAKHVFLNQLKAKNARICEDHAYQDLQNRYYLKALKEQQLEELYQQMHQHLIDDGHFHYPEWAEQFTEFVCYLEEWLNAERNLHCVLQDQQQCNQDWEKLQLEFADTIINHFLDLVFPLNDGNKISFKLSRSEKEDLRTSLKSIPLPVLAHKQYPAKLAQFELLTDDWLTQQNKKNSATSCEDHINAQQNAVEKMNLSSPTLLFNRLLPKLTNAMKRQLSEDEKRQINWEHPKQEWQKNLEVLLRKNLDLNPVLTKMADLNQRTISNNVNIAALRQQRDENRAAAEEVLKNLQSAYAQNSKPYTEITALLEQMALEPEIKNATQFAWKNRR